jgi:nucleotide-binding universal stress UspA family protein
MGVFERIVCGVDGSEESLEAVRQAGILLEPDGRLLLVAVADLTRAVHLQVAPTAIHALRRALAEADELDRAAQEALERARAQIAAGVEVGTLETGGLPASCLLDSVVAERATSLVVGTHGLGRAAGIVLGSVATRMLHRAACSLLVARRGARGAWAPRRIVVGSHEAEGLDAALRTARELETRFQGAIRVEPIAGVRAEHALVEAAAEADLLIVEADSHHSGHGLGSVAERAAHEARCSVLVVRRPDPQSRRGA